MMKQLKTTSLCLLAVLSLTSCLEEPKAKKEIITNVDQFDKMVDDLVGEGSITPTAIQLGQKDTRVDTVSISGQLTRQLLRRELVVTQADIDYVGGLFKKGTYRFKSTYKEWNENAELIQDTTVERPTILEVNNDGYYVFTDIDSPYTVHSWDYILQLRQGFCHSGENDDFKLEVTCSNVSVSASMWGNTKIPLVPVRVLKVLRSSTITDKKTGETQSSKVHYTFQVAPGLPEISKVVSVCSEGLQQFGNNIYYLTRCNTLESL